MENTNLEYNKLKLEYKSYQEEAESLIQSLSKKNMKLEKDLNVLTNIVEISKYINSFLSDENLILMINDMIVGLLGVAYSTIFLEEDGEFSIKATNLKNKHVQLTSEENVYVKNEQDYLINDKGGLRSYEKDNALKVCSAIGMPIKLRDKFFGFILVEHQLYNFLDNDHKKFLKSIATQIAICLENSILYRELEDTAKKDPLLGIYNRRYFFEVIEKQTIHKPQEPFAIVMIDLDNFKSINDFYGHQFGDKVLIETTEIIRKKMKSKDILARYGGEEIIIYMNDFENFDEVYERIECIREQISQNEIREGNLYKKVTASFGIACYPNDGKSVNQIIASADLLLYESKKKGKNRVSYIGMNCKV